MEHDSGLVFLASHVVFADDLVSLITVTSVMLPSVSIQLHVYSFLQEAKKSAIEVNANKVIFFIFFIIVIV